MSIKQIEISQVSRNSALYIDFLYQNLGRFRDDKDSITKCFDYLTSNQGGGYCFEYREAELKGLVVLLNTHMSGFLPEHFLVYICVHESAQGQGIGSKLLEKVQEDLPGEICLHVEPDNPALNLYKRKGFTNKYLEMRFLRG
jgi:ribosomal protein S18 acetylase RimI-like enzyme